VTFEFGKYKLIINNETNYDSNSLELFADYDKNFLTESEYLLSTIFGLKIFEKETQISSAIIGSEGGASGLSENSQIIETDRILICCSDSVYCLNLPSLDLNWKIKPDEITSFRIFKIDGGYIIHGEIQITRININGEILWKQGGADIFVNPDGEDELEITEEYIKAVDWENRVYKWDLNGKEIA
jgi:hypothetical protein|tara:strand:- start:103 stop:657 length:555 start_codon:yes stop_codon:yes gene_type:complete